MSQDSNPVDAEAILLMPYESIALTVAWAQVQRMETPEPGVVAVCVMALARLAGRENSS